MGVEREVDNYLEEIELKQTLEQIVNTLIDINRRLLKLEEEWENN